MQLKKLIWILLIPSLAFAFNSNEIHTLSISGGIAAPSASTSVFQNPAGLIYSSNLSLNAQVSADDSLSNPSYRGGFLYGGNNIGIAGGVGNNSSEASVTSAFFGLAIEISQLSTSFGLSGFTGLSPLGGTSYNAGVIIMPMSNYQLGFTAIGINSGVQEWGGGVDIKLDSVVSLVLDVSTNKSFNSFNFKPGLGVINQNIGLTISYGTQQSGSQELSSGFTIGGSLELRKTLSWQVYYNELAKFYTSLSLRL